MKKTAIAPANIAFIKYWAKADSKERIPKNDSISMCLSEMVSVCTVEFDPQRKSDDITFSGEDVVTEKELKRIVSCLDRVRTATRVNEYAKVVTKNNFPKATGIASSASGFAALTLASVAAAGADMSEKELSILSRMSSGTACRSIPSGFVRWHKGEDSRSSYAEQIYPPDHWEICDVVVIVSSKMKKISSTKGHELAPTSPFYQARMDGMERKLHAIEEAIQKKDFSSFGRIIEDEALNMHAICLTSTPPIIYWESATLGIIKSVARLREDGLEGYVTIDAGPSVHLMCRQRDSEKFVQHFEQFEGVQKVVVNKPGRGAYLSDTHLF